METNCFGFHENHVFAFLGIEKDFAFVCPMSNFQQITIQHVNCFYWIFAKSKQTSVIRITGDVNRASSMVMEAKIEALKKAANVTTLVGTENLDHPEFQIGSYRKCRSS